MIKITFQVKNPEWKAFTIWEAFSMCHGDTDFDSPYINIADPTDSLSNLFGADDIVIVKSHVLVTIKYPVDNPATFTVQANDPVKGFTRKELVKKICDLYAQMYEEERVSIIIPIDPQMLNRNQTNGKYQIWGPDIGDLLLHTIHYNEIDNTCTLEVDS